MTITINSTNIEAIFGDVPGTVETSEQTATNELAAPTGVATFSIFARRRRRRPGEGRTGTVRRPGAVEARPRGARHAS